MGFPVLNKIFERLPEQNVDLRPGVQLEFVTAPRQSLALGLDYNKTSFYIGNGYTVGPANRPQYAHLYDTRVLSAALTYRWFLAGLYAPLGPFIGVGAYASRIGLTPQADKVLKNWLADSTYTRFGIQAEAGRNYMIANKVLLNIGVRYSFTIANPFRYDYQGVIITPEERIRYAETNPMRQMNADLWMAQLMILNIGIGFLPF